MLQPVRTKFRKAFKGRIHGKASRAIKLNYGQFGLKATEPERIIGKQIEVRMGKGKGSPEYYACRVKPGRVIFEIDGVSEDVAREALYKASAKLPIKTKFIKR